MDNLTHTLIGATLAESFKESDSNAKRAMFWTSIVASNFPDLDFLIPHFFEHQKLAYLLHHRGITHTLIFTPVTAILTVLAVCLFFRGAFIHRKKLFLIAVLGALLHIVADGWNSYGVHPFFPFWNGWLYGDMIFIVEPLIWFVLLPYWFWYAKRIKVRFAALILAIGMVCFAAFGPYPVALFSLVNMIAFGCLAFYLQRVFPKIRIAWFGLALVLGVFWFASRQAHTEASRLFTQETKMQETLFELALSPSPSNPLCWKAQWVSEDAQTGQYRVRVGNLSLSENIVPANTCFLSSVDRTVSLKKIDWAVPSGFTFEGFFSAEKPDFSRVSQHCFAQAFFRFARVPYWEWKDDFLILSDARYDRGTEIGFSEFMIASDAACPRGIPPWIPPTIKAPSVF